MQASAQAPSHELASLPTAPEQWGHPNTAGYAPPPPPFLSMADLQLVALDIKTTLSAAISDLKADLRAAAARVEIVESVAMTHGAAIQQVQKVNDTQARHLIEIHRHMEDLENRGRRRNLQIRGILENIESPQLQPAVWAICNTLLGRPPDAPIDMERCHRALRPRGR